MSNVLWWTNARRNLFKLFLDIKGSIKRFNYIERVAGEAERKYFEATKDAALKEEMGFTIKIILMKKNKRQYSI